MGITIHYRLRFKGTEAQVKEILQKLEEPARRLKFREIGPIWQVFYADDFNMVDAVTPTRKNRQGKQVIDDDYRWAKIQYQPKGVIFNSKDTELERRLKERQVRHLVKILPEYTGLIRKFWHSDGCEATNIGLIHRKASTHWMGSWINSTGRRAASAPSLA